MDRRRGVGGALWPVDGPGWRGRLISHAPQLGRMGARSSPPVYAARSPAPLTRGRWAALRSEPGITSARTFRGSEDDIPSGMRGWGGDGTERRRSRWSEAEAAAHPAGGEGEATAQRVGDRGGSPSGRRKRGRNSGTNRAQKKQSYRSIGVSLYYSSDALIALMFRGCGAATSRAYIR